MGVSSISVMVDLPEQAPYSSVTLRLDEQTGVRTFRVQHAQGPQPTLSLTHGGITVIITPDQAGAVTGQDVTVARDLLTAVTAYVTDIERLHTERPGESAPDIPADTSAA